MSDALKLAAAAGFFLIPALVLGGCESDEPDAFALLGGGCLLASDCDPGLACVFQRCHFECNGSTDCPLDDDGERLRCVLGDKPDHVCQLPDEATCTYHSECPGTQICGPDTRCRDQCQDDRDCVEGQKCASGACADEDELDEMGELTGVAPPPEQATGFPCVYDSDCLGVSTIENLEYVCIDGGCNVECYADVDCERTFTCVPASGEDGTAGACTFIGEGAPCIPGEQVLCDCWPDGMQDGYQTCNDSGAFDVCAKEENGMRVDCGVPSP